MSEVREYNKLREHLKEVRCNTSKCNKYSDCVMCKKEASKQDIDIKIYCLFGYGQRYEGLRDSDLPSLTEEEELYMLVRYPSLYKVYKVNKSLNIH